MSLLEILPQARALSRREKLQLIRHLAQELADEDTASLIEPNRDYPVWSPHDAYDAAAALLRALEADKDKT